MAMMAEHLASFKKWFSDYVATFYAQARMDNEIIKLKEEHTKRVCSEIVMLGQALNLPEEEMLLAETMALFHDLGRFKQYATFGTFEDARSENHAALGLRELAREDVLSVCSDAERSLMTKAIGYHNARALPTDEDKGTLFFSRLLRDADKLDIWQIFIEYYGSPCKQQNAMIVWGLPDEPRCSPKIVNALLRQEMADTRHMETLNDYKLLQMSWVFDINFAPTFEAVEERRYVQKIAATITPGLQVEAMIETVLDHLQNRQTLREPSYG